MVEQMDLRVKVAAIVIVGQQKEIARLAERADASEAGKERLLRKLDAAVRERDEARASALEGAARLCVGMTLGADPADAPYVAGGIKALTEAARGIRALAQTTVGRREHVAGDVSKDPGFVDARRGDESGDRKVK